MKKNDVQASLSLIAKLPRCSRRQFLRVASVGMAGGAVAPFSLFGAEEPPDPWDPSKPLLDPAKTLHIQTVLIYSLGTPKPETSWKSWGGVQTEKDVARELKRIGGELALMSDGADFPVRFKPIVKVSSLEEAQKLRESACDAVLLYACSGGGDLLKACALPDKDTVVFVRRQSGPVYYWYEALSTKFLEPAGKGVSAPSAAHALHVDDVVVDDYQEVLWRLRALSGVKNLRGTRVVALGGPWGKYSPEAPDFAHAKFGLEIIDVSYDELATRLTQARANQSLTAAFERWTERYLAVPGTKLQTQKPFVVNAFMLYRIFKDLLNEHQAHAFTVKSCMGTIIPMSKTTACLSLSLLNDEGLLAFCESDFVVIPAGILLRHLAGTPVFLHNSTFPHQGIVTCAHCTGPRRMNGRRYEPATLVTHYESDYGAAPKVEMPVGQEVTFLDPDYSTGRWVGFKGVVRSNPAYAICRSQQDVEIRGPWQKLKNEVRDSHWLMVYGDYLQEAGYAARKLGLTWFNLSDS